MQVNSVRRELVFDNSKIKIASVLAVATIIAASFAGLFMASYSDARSDFEVSDAELKAATEAEFAKLSAEYDQKMMAEYGITYAEYNLLMSYFFNKAVYITVEDGEPVAYFVESIDKGKTMTDSELRGDRLRIYIDTVSMAMLVSAGINGFTTALGALLGTVALPGIGTLSGGALGAIIGLFAGTTLSGLYQFVTEQYHADNGIWIDITIRGHFEVFGHRVYYPLPPFMWKLNGYGAQ